GRTSGLDGGAGRVARRFGLLRRFPVTGDPALTELVVRNAAGAAEALAADVGVLYVGPASPGLAPLDEIGDQITAGNIAGTAVAPGYARWLADRGLDGAGVRVSIVDTGIDAHPDLSSRIVARVNYGASPAGEPNDIGGHGTHVAGIVGGDATGVSGVARPADAQGFLFGLGMAPKVELVDQNAIASTAAPLCGNGFWPPAYPWSRLTEDALDRGAGIWNASWWSCEAQGGGYLASSRAMDALVRDGHPGRDGSQPFTMVAAAGNFATVNGGMRNIGSPWEAKNPISVAASMNTRGGNPNTLASFSSRGPAADGRVLPTVAAPGASVVSTRSFAGSACGVPHGAESLGLYSLCSGTSMASPHAAGAVALITQWWRRGHEGADPSPAMAKALLVNSATDMGAADIPNRFEGWGRVNLNRLLEPGVQRHAFDQSTLLTDPGQSFELAIQPDDPSKPVKVTLVWTDAPGAAGANPALVNDLDLQVVDASGLPWWGNSFVGGRSVPGGAPNRLDNVENVFIQQPDGAYRVRVVAENLPGDGVPGAGDDTDQDFALVVTNARLVAG
ncbi:MAG: S8 family serine peptidase, partial [Actinomycetota bacterium]|nr:S8 family serine peptidase [Actinomycetota bacterium]